MGRQVSDDRIPVVIVTGFLGSGKTTFLRRSLECPQLSGSILLVNEAAAFGVDDRILRSDDRPVELLANGCACCRIDGAVNDALRALVEPDAAVPPFKRVIMELSGLADPLAVIATIASDAALERRFHVASVITLVDCVNAEETARLEPEHRSQIEAADFVLLTKTDLACQAAIDAAADYVHAVQPLAICRRAGELLLHEVVALQQFVRPDTIVRFALPLGGSRASSSRRFVCSPEAATTFTLEVDGRLDWTRLSLWLALLLHEHGTKVLRIKGLLHFDNAEAPVLINCVRHIAYFPEHLDPGTTTLACSCLVFIVRELGPAQIARSFAACLNAPSTRLVLSTQS